MELTHGHLLAGRLRYAQPRDGYRTGIEPVLLAAACPARPGQRILEAFCGAAAGLLCLAARIPDIQAVGVELDPAMADLARQNLADNAIAQIEIVTADIADVALAPVDHAFANPPWHDPASTASPLQRRRLAKQAGPGDLERWIAALDRALRPGGTLTLILPAAQIPRARAALGPIGALTIHTLAPKQDRPPKLAILQTRKGLATPDTEQRSILHQPDGAFTPEIDAVLRHGAALPPADPIAR